MRKITAVSGGKLEGRRKKISKSLNRKKRGQKK
jgi:hypothetical protein